MDDRKLERDVRKARMAAVTGAANGVSEGPCGSIAGYAQGNAIADQKERLGCDTTPERSAYLVGQSQGRLQGQLEMDMHLTRENLDLTLQRMRRMACCNRNFELAITHLEDCISRFDRAIESERTTR